MEGLLAAGRDLISFQVRGQSKSASAVLLRVGHVCGWAIASLCQACPGKVSPRRVALKVAFPGGSSVPEEQVPLSLSTSASALPVILSTIGINPCSVPLGERNAWNRWNKIVNRNPGFVLFRSTPCAEQPEQVEQRSQPGAVIWRVIPGEC